MRINSDNNLSTENLKTPSLFKKLEMRTSKNLNDINADIFNLSKFHYPNYTIKNTVSPIKNKKGNSLSDIILNDENNKGISDNVTTNTNQNLNSPKSKSNPKVSKNIEKINSFQESKSKKKVKFKKDFATIIQIQSYKKYNINKYCNNNSINCSCAIF